MNDNYKFYEKDNSSYIGSRIEGNPTNHPGKLMRTLGQIVFNREIVDVKAK